MSGRRVHAALACWATAACAVWANHAGIVSVPLCICIAQAMGKPATPEATHLLARARCELRALTMGMELLANAADFAEHGGVAGVCHCAQAVQEGRDPSSWR